MVSSASGGDTTQGVAGVQRGIPTMYSGVQFRSRIEARWAAFFDALKWDWDYEPIDLDGYIPDFVLPFQKAPLLVEVKSALHLPYELYDHKEKVMRSGWGGEALVVGGRLGALAGGGDMLCGIFGSRESIPAGSSSHCRGGRTSLDSELEWLWDDGLLFWCVPCRGASIAQYNSSWRCRRCGIDDGEHRGFPKEGIFNDAWIDAGNAVQWKAPT